MNFDLTEEQVLLRETLGRFLDDRYSFETRRALRRESLGWSRATWRWLAENGYLAAPFAEQDGGLGGGAVEVMVIAEAFGAHLVAEPYLASVVLAGTALKLSPPSSIRDAAIAAIITGEATAAFCADVSKHGVTALHEADGWRLYGGRSGILQGGEADRLVIAATTSEGRGIFLIDMESKGIARRGHATFDALRAADIDLHGTPADLLALGDRAEDAIERVVQHGIAYLAAEAVGIMRRLLDLTVEHLKTRKQFGQTLGSFQALSHRAVDMLVAVEQAESAKLYATMMADHPDRLERQKAFAAVKAVIGGAARSVGQAAVQLHGGIGVTDEHYVGWGMRRLTMIEMSLGDTDRHVAALADLGGFLAAAE